MKTHLPDKGLTLSFPDGMTENQMRDASNRNFYPEKLSPQAAAPAAPIVVSAVPTPAPVQATSSSAAAEQQAAAILAQEIRPVEKVETLNAFAGAAYVSNDYSGAKTLLMAALRLDPGCDATLRNMALLLHDMGERDKALQVAAKMRMADFMLLRELKR